MGNLRIVMLPYLAYGHITPFFELAKKLSDRGFSIDICSTPINLSFIKEKISEKYSSSIHLVELHLPNLPELPPHHHTTNGLPKHLKQTLFKALKMTKPQFHQILSDKKPDFLIYDIMLLWSARVASTLNIPSLKFYTVNAAIFCYFSHFYRKPGEEFPFPALYMRDYENEQMTHDVADDAEVEIDKDNLTEFDMFVLVDSSRSIDGKYTDYLWETGQAKVVPIGTRFHQDHVGNLDNNGDDMDLIKWLDMKTEHSTVYVSFGSEYFLTKEEMEEIAYGLELSNVDFIWVVRFQKGEQVALPQGFVERIGDRGRIVEGWAPQQRILNHPSIGGFVTHCGWNSSLESIEFGVPIIGIPMLYDQPLNARLLVEIGVAIEVPRDGNGNLDRVNITENIKRVISDENLRKNMCNLGENVRSRREEEMDGVVEVIQLLRDEKNAALMNK
ncbi:beta-D-glucosyl crocetin beta-1,6-glucosyltransferase-like [Solanum dulcamara]|uniref:beta-D-glucosyl crocetin beta-1,6-glucosyltransferase-like n=1 Tax=Solanum dulcamara TaxID=45834 RepID=UPI00248504C0|nr:beta-D-glucosyl crocetin beta-1,6-glucosyltransferase-like [Solanum dulcamara]